MKPEKYAHKIDEKYKLIFQRRYKKVIEAVKEQHKFELEKIRHYVNGEAIREKAALKKRFI